MYYLVIDTRFAAPVHVFLDQNPRPDPDFPSGLQVRTVTLEPAAETSARGSSGSAIGQDPFRPDTYRLFGSTEAMNAAGFSEIEPRFVGTNWHAYDRVFRYGAKTVSRH